MPLDAFESEVLRAIAANLHQQSYSPRSSHDVDLFHDTMAALASAVLEDLNALQAAGFSVELGPDRETFRRAIVKKAGRETKVQRVFDSAFRFFPFEPGFANSLWHALRDELRYGIRTIDTTAAGISTLAGE